MLKEIQCHAFAGKNGSRGTFHRGYHITRRYRVPIPVLNTERDRGIQRLENFSNNGNSRHRQRLFGLYRSARCRLGRNEGRCGHIPVSNVFFERPFDKGRKVEWKKSRVRHAIQETIF